MTRLSILFLCAAAMWLDGCAAPPPRLHDAQVSAVLERVTWGLNDATFRQADTTGLDQYLQQQLHPGAARLPAEIEAQIRALTISQRTVEQLNQEMEQRRKAADATADNNEKRAAQNAYQQEMSRLAREAATRALLLALYSPNQLQEQMTWFWMNHFNVNAAKSNLRMLVGDYEDTAVRAHALGKFRDLLAATVRHPAMLRYLDNDQNAVNHINENYARELCTMWCRRFVLRTTTNRS